MFFVVRIEIWMMETCCLDFKCVCEGAAEGGKIDVLQWPEPLRTFEQQN